MMSVSLCVTGSFSFVSMLVLNSICYGHTQEVRAVVTLQPNWPKIYREETISLRCEIENAGHSLWEYKWETNSSIKPSNGYEHRITAYVFHSGHYRCQGTNISGHQSSTNWSDPLNLKVHGYIPKPVLTVCPSWLSPGDSVSLNCRIEHPSAGWRFYWYKTVADLSQSTYKNVLLPGSINGTAEYSYIIPGQTARYVCRAQRGRYYSHFSEPKFVWSGAFDTAASLTVTPDRVQYFPSESISLNCEGNSTEWRVMRLTDTGPSRCHGWGTMAGSTCTIHSLQYSDAVYWCVTGSGDFSNAVNITVHTSRPESSSFTVTLFAGIIIGIFVVVLLLLVHRLTTSNSACSRRTTQTRSTDKDQQTNPRVSQDHVYSVLHPGDACIYDSIRGFDYTGNTGHDGQAKQCRGVTFDSAQLKAQGLNKRSELDDQTL
ncbi:uncharacterized protein LOC113157607 [Anabas testudineus]|uniref:Ig-like domain-containing protein n=1 Tax=Anabas testudineus TaxID=64144 RepID=A0AAQ6IM26_ANATE|nr:uncharacterized protein LOC113157607 [Anabas testudineus]